MKPPCRSPARRQDGRSPAGGRGSSARVLEKAEMMAAESSALVAERGVSSSIIKFGRPRVWLLSEGRTQQDILHAIKAGRVTISATEDTARLEIRADRNLNGSYDTLLGDIVSLTSNTEVDFHITLDGSGAVGQVIDVEQEFIDNINGAVRNQDELLSDA